MPRWTWLLLAEITRQWHGLVSTETPTPTHRGREGEGEGERERERGRGRGREGEEEREKREREREGERKSGRDMRAQRGHRPHTPKGQAGSRSVLEIGANEEVRTRVACRGSDVDEGAKTGSVWCVKRNLVLAGHCHSTRWGVCTVPIVR